MADGPGRATPAGHRSAGSRLGFRSRLTLALLVGSIVPLVGFAVVVLVFGSLLGGGLDATLVQVLLFALATLIVFAIVASFALATDLTAPLRGLVASVAHVSRGEPGDPIAIVGDDEFARLADSHNLLAADLARRNAEIGRILASIDEVAPSDDVNALVQRTGDDATAVFGLIDAVVVMGDPAHVVAQEVVPGVSRPLRAVLRARGEDLGVLIGRLPATRGWERADQDLFELFASAMAAAIRNAQLFATIQRQNRQLVELNKAKDDFLRGVSHNLQTPLTSIRAYAEQLDEAAPDRRLGIIAEQSERLSRMVRQLLMVSRLESGALHPRSEVLSLATRVRKAWEALAAEDVPFTLDDGAAGWLAIADADQLDQVLWALLDNAVKYGGGSPVSAIVAVEESFGQVRLTIADRGPGIADVDRSGLFTRFERGRAPAADGGSGLGLYVSRELCRAMGGELVVDPAGAGPGAAFTIILPGEPGHEA